MTQAAEGRLATVYPIENEIRKGDVKFHRRISIIREFASTTSAHGLPNLSRSTNMHNRMFWTISTLAFTGIMVFFVTQSMRAYFSYPTQTSVSINAQRIQNFPAVTICNVSPIRFDNFIGPFLNYTNSLNLTNTNDTTTVSEAQVRYVNDFLQYAVQNSASSNTDDFGFSLESMLIQCTYNGIQCTRADFISFVSANFGNCYTFNAKMKVNDSNVRSTVENGGIGLLEMRLYVHSHQYVPYLSDDISAGMVALVHDNRAVPLIDSTNIGLDGGRRHKLSYKRKVYDTLSSPYSNCTDKVSAVMDNMIGNYGGADYSYTQIACYILCIQAYVYNQCGCVNPALWTMRSVQIHGSDQIIKAAACNYTDPCFSNATVRLTTAQSIWDQYCSDCSPQCLTVDFVITPSALSAPSSTYQYTIKQFVENSNVPLPKNWLTTWQTEVKNNYVALQVFCDSNIVEDYSDSPSISGDDLLSNIGGQSGLWIGISFLSIMELVEMFYRLIRHQYHVFRRRISTRNE